MFHNIGVRSFSRKVRYEEEIKLSPDGLVEPDESNVVRENVVHLWGRAGSVATEVRTEQRPDPSVP